MSDLICTRCGATATYADASIYDSEESCRVFRFDQNGDAVEVPAEHNWEE